MTAVCRHCGHPNEDWASYCANCGRPLQAVPATPQAYPHPQDRGRTRTGLLLLTVGVVLSAIPYVSFVGFLLLIVGVLLLFLGADAFGARHRRLVLASVLLYILVLVATGAALVVLLFQAVVALAPSAPPTAIEGVWRSALLALGIGLGAMTVPFLLITWELQDARGRRFLWLALGINLGGTAALVWFLFPFAGVFTAAAAGDIGPLAALANLPVLLLYSLTSLAWAYPYFLAYRRVTTPPPSGAADAV
ncbi:MAG: zinc-ribbon domain-containing protein [Thermoplasmata archaeon]